MEREAKQRQVEERGPWQKPIEELCCVNADCPLCGRKAAGNLTVRKGKGSPNWRVLRCGACKKEFSERKGTAMYGSHLEPEKFIAIAEHLKEGMGVRATGRLCKTRPDTVSLVGLRVGTHARALHEEKAQELQVNEVQFDEKWNFVGKKR